MADFGTTRCMGLRLGLSPRLAVCEGVSGESHAATDLSLVSRPRPPRAVDDES